jgi:hypothetical protein
VNLLVVSNKCQSEPQYKYKFKSWKWKKNISSTKKAQICEVVQTRAALGKSGIVKYKGKEVDEKKLRRYTKEKHREQLVLRSSAQHTEYPGGGIFNSSIPLGNTM